MWPFKKRTDEEMFEENIVKIENSDAIKIYFPMLIAMTDGKTRRSLEQTRDEIRNIRKIIGDQSRKRPLLAIYTNLDNSSIGEDREKEIAINLVKKLIEVMLHLCDTFISYTSDLSHSYALLKLDKLQVTLDLFEDAVRPLRKRMSGW